MLSPDNRFSPMMDVRFLRDLPNVYDVKDKGQCIINNYGGPETVTINWQLNDDSCRNNMFEIDIDGTKAVLSYDEFLFIGRVMFAHKEYNTRI